ncbi:MAG: NADPH-dependent F420 reductase [Actinomycetia bacterium]|nr:NADPH-dependent F420 reductase [Actinomycetes bacterium]
MDERVATGGQRQPPPRPRSVGVIGGTGALGRGLAVRLAAAGHSVRLGSRDFQRARAAAEMLGEGVTGASNVDACDSELVVFAVPWAAHEVTLASLRDALDGRIVIDCVNPLGFDERGPFALAVADGSATQQADELLADSTVVGAFHHVSAELLLAAGELDADVLVVGDDRPAVEQVIELIDSISGLRGVYAGRLRNAGQVEALTANLIAINRRYRVQSGIRVTGLAASSDSSQ